MSTPQPDITTLLDLAGQGDRAAQEQLFRQVEPELRKLAKSRLRGQRLSPGVQTTVLVDEAFLRLIGDRQVTWQGRSHFYRFAGRVMRLFLVDQARQEMAARRGGGEGNRPLDQVANPIDPRGQDPFTILAVHDALTQMAETHPDLIEIVELHHFGGWDLRQIADEVLHIPYVTVKRRWQRARALLHRALSGGEHDT
jgi:RNA polymerase sigma factor (TIGR02999 family)